MVHKLNDESVLAQLPSYIRKDISELNSIVFSRRKVTSEEFLCSGSDFFGTPTSCLAYGGKFAILNFSHEKGVKEGKLYQNQTNYDCIYEPSEEKLNFRKLS